MTPATSPRPSPASTNNQPLRSAGIRFWAADLAAELHDENTPPWLMRLVRLAPVLVALSALIASGRALLSSQSWIVRFEDDFFYYLKIAQNLAHGHGSTFNGIVATNGYHPLWLLLLTVFSLVTTNPRAIFAFVALVALLSSLATFYLARSILRQAVCGYVLRQGLAAYIAIYALHIFYTGMEVILAVPLMFLVVAIAARPARRQRGTIQAAGLGLAISAMVLARLDLILLAALLLSWALLSRDLRRRLTPAVVSGLLLGLMPLAAYFLVNRAVFHTWLPVSGMAKQLKFHHLPTLRPWLTVYSPNINNRLNQLPIHLAILALPLVWKRLSAMQRILLPSILLFPTVYFLLLSCLSDWQLWLWYLYPLRAALCGSIVVFSIWPPTARIVRSRAAAALVLVVVLGEVAVSKWWTDVNPVIYAGAADIAAFARTHPGIYAMGDRSGMAAYLMTDPIVQTEGLVMDRAFLDRIRRQEPLLSVLRAYHVRYYVATAWAPYTGCFHAVEPFQAGKTSAHMQGDLCSPPVAAFQHEIFRNIVFDLDREPADPPMTSR